MSHKTLNQQNQKSIEKICRATAAKQFLLDAIIITFSKIPINHRMVNGFVIRSQNISISRAGTQLPLPFGQTKPKNTSANFSIEKRYHADHFEQCTTSAQRTKMYRCRQQSTIESFSLASRIEKNQSIDFVGVFVSLVHSPSHHNTN